MARLEEICPVLAWRDVGAALAHYGQLGFEATAYDGGADYGFLQRDGVHLHVSRIDGDGPVATTEISAYLYVDDADALLAEWQGAGVDGRFDGAYDTEYGLREFCHIDPAGNLLRVGSRAAG